MKLCLVCNNKLGWIRGKTIDKKFICSKCLEKYGIKSQVSKMTSVAIENFINFKSTLNVGDYLYINENTKEWLIKDEFCKIYKFEDIRNIELIEESNAFNKAYCTNMNIKITVNDMKSPVMFIKFITRQTGKPSKRYKKAFEHANKCSAILELISK